MTCLAIIREQFSSAHLLALTLRQIRFSFFCVFLLRKVAPFPSPLHGSGGTNRQIFGEAYR